MTKPALHLIDTDTGELQEGCENCAALKDQLAEAEGEIRSYRAKLRQAKRNAEAEVRKHELWPAAVELFGYWKTKCNHPRSRFTYDRFEVARPMLAEYGMELCKKAIDGAAYDCFETKRRNGTIKKHDDFDLVLRNATKLEEFACRAPLSDTQAG